MDDANTIIAPRVRNLAVSLPPKPISKNLMRVATFDFYGTELAVKNCEMCLWKGNVTLRAGSENARFLSHAKQAVIDEVIEAAKLGGINLAHTLKLETTEVV